MQIVGSLLGLSRDLMPAESQLLLPMVDMDTPLQAERRDGSSEGRKRPGEAEWIAERLKADGRTYESE